VRRDRRREVETDAGTARGFSWWGPHDRARRSARLLLGAIATICSLYAAVVILTVTFAVRLSEIGPWRSLAAWQHDLGAARLVGAAIAVTAALAAIIALIAAEGIAGRAIRLARARRPSAAEAAHAQSTIDNFALGVGFRAPRLGIVDDEAPNGFGAGRRRLCVVCLTTGALGLPDDELDALCSYTITSVSNRAVPLACAAADLVRVANWCTKAIWSMAGLIVVSSLLGVPVEFVALTTLVVVLLVVCTQPLLVIADRAIARLLDNSARLADLDTVRVTNQPAALARLLLTAAADDQKVATHWQIAHLWFDPDTSRPPMPTWQRSIAFWTSDDDLDDTHVALRNARSARQMLIGRARVIVDLTSGEPKLRERLADAARA
jgi:hypothetical protein